MLIVDIVDAVIELENVRWGRAGLIIKCTGQLWRTCVLELGIGISVMISVDPLNDGSDSD